MTTIKERWTAFIRPVVKPLEDVWRLPERAEGQVAGATGWLMKHMPSGVSAELALDNYSELLMGLIIHAAGFDGHIPLELYTTNRFGWTAHENKLLRNIGYRLFVDYEYTFKHPRVISCQKKNDEGQTVVVAALFAKDIDEMKNGVSGLHSQHPSNFTYYPGTHMLVEKAMTAREGTNVYRHISTVYTPRGHDPMHVWIRAETKK